MWDKLCSLFDYKLENLFYSYMLVLLCYIVLLVTIIITLGVISISLDIIKGL